jgi:hypothetical protein
VSTSLSILGKLDGVAAISAGDAWAVGSSRPADNSKTLTGHWNGRKWTRVTSPKPVSGSLEAVTATSADTWS